MSAPQSDNKVSLPDVEALFETLLGQLKPRVSHAAGMVGIVTGGVWLAERLHAALGLRAPPGDAGRVVLSR